MFSFKRYYKIFIRLVSRNISTRYLWFEWIFPFEFLQIIISISSWFFINKMFNGSSTILKEYGGDFLTFLILGISVNSLFNIALTRFYQILLNIYTTQFAMGGIRLGWSDYLELAGIPVSVYILSQLFWDIIEHIVIILTYIIVGIYMFGMTFSTNANYAFALLTLLLGFIGTSGLGLISASMIWLIGAWHGREPIQWFISLFSSLLSGVYFPISLLPDAVQKLGIFIPQTYALEIMRYSLLNPEKNVSLNFIILLSISICYFIIGVFMFRKSLKISKEKASLL